MQTMEILKDQGHLLVELDGRRALLDTGSPASMAPEPFEFLGKEHVAATSIMGITPAQMSELAGIRIDILIGCDILADHKLRLRWRDGELDAGDDIEDAPLVSELAIPMNMPVFPLTLKGQTSHAIFDTGAHLAYVDPDLVAGETASGERTDFYPMVGRFTVSTYRISTALDANPFDLEYGVPPEDLEPMLGMAMDMTGASAVIGTQILDIFDCTISWKDRSISWSR